MLHLSDGLTFREIALVKGGSGRVQLKLGEWCLVGLQSDLASGLVLLIKATRSR